MSIGKAFIIVHFIILLTWWLIVNALGVQETLGGTFFIFGLGAYIFGLSTLFLYLILVKEWVKYRSVAVIAFTGMSLLGFGYLVMFYNNYVFNVVLRPNSVVSFFFFFQFPLLMFALLHLFNPRSVPYIKIVGQVVLFYVCILLLNLVFTQHYFDEDLWYGYTEFYYVLESFSTFILVVSIMIKFYNSINNFTISRNFMLFIVTGVSFNLVGDLMSAYLYLTGTYISATIPELVYLVSAFCLLYGYFGLINGDFKTEIIESESPMYLRKVSYFKPYSLN